MHGDHEQEQKIGSNYRALTYHKDWRVLLTLGALFGSGLFNIFPDHQPAPFGPVFFVLYSGRVGSGRDSGRDSGIVAIEPVDINGLEVITRAQICPDQVKLSWIQEKATRRPLARYFTL